MDGIRSIAQSSSSLTGKDNYIMASKNSQSVVAKIIYGNTKYLSTGDKEIFVDELLLGKASSTSWWTASTATNTKKEKQTLKVSLAKDIATAEKITAAQAVSKYKLNRFTAKDVRAQVYKWGHHSRPSGGTLDLVKAVNPDKIVFSAHSYKGVYMENNVLATVKSYYDSRSDIPLNSSNWNKNNSKGKVRWTQWVFSTNRGNNNKTVLSKVGNTYTSGFIIKTNGTSWDYSGPQNK